MLEDGFYVVETADGRTVAEYISGNWYQCGLDYDIWEVLNTQVRVVRRIDLTLGDIS